MPLVEQQQPQLAQGLARDALAAPEPVVERRDEHEVLVEQGQFGDAGHPERHGEKQQIEPPRREPFEQGRRLLLVDLEVQVRVLLVDEAQDGRQEVGRDGGDDAEAERSRERRPYRLGLLHQRAHLVEHGLRAHREPLTLGREQYLAGSAFEQGHAEGLLQGGHGAGERGLAHADRGGGVPEVQMLGDGGEGPQLREARLSPLGAGHGHSPYLRLLIARSDQHDRV